MKILDARGNLHSKKNPMNIHHKIRWTSNAPWCNGLVRKSACCSSDGTWTTLNSPFATRSRMKLWRMSMCFELGVVAGFLAKWIAPTLSSLTKVHPTSRAGNIKLQIYRKKNRLLAPRGHRNILHLSGRKGDTLLRRNMFVLRRWSWHYILYSPPSWTS